MGAVEASSAPPPDVSLAMQIVEEMSPVTAPDIIPLLQRLQGVYGYLPRDVVLEVCQRTGLPASRVFGVATFYGQFQLEPRGRHLIRCCRGTACHVKGGKHVIEAVQRELALDEGRASGDVRFTFETVACLGECFAAPAMMVDEDCCGNVAAGRVKEVLDRYE